MPKGYPISDDEKLHILELLEAGHTPKEVAAKTDCSVKTIYRIRADFYGKDVRSMDCVVAGDKKYGTLTATGANHYVGTCLVAGGKMKKRHFTIKGSKNAIAAWEAWKKNVRAITPTNDVPEKEPETAVKVAEKADDSFWNNDSVAAWEAWKKNARASNQTNDIPEKEPEMAVKVNDPATEWTNNNDTLPTLYAISVDNPRIMGYFLTRQEADAAVASANKALEFAGLAPVYSVAEISPM